MRRSAFMLAVLLAALVPLRANAYCMTGPIQTAIGNADALFVGIPIQQTTFPFNAASFTDAVTMFQVLDMLKGEKVEIVSVWHCTSCAEGLSFRLGEHVLVSAHKYEGRLKSSYCSLGEYSLADVRATMREAAKSR